MFPALLFLRCVFVLLPQVPDTSGALCVRVASGARSEQRASGGLQPAQPALAGWCFLCALPAAGRRTTQQP